MHQSCIGKLGLLMWLFAASARAGSWEVGAGYAGRIDGEASWLTTVAYVTQESRFPWEWMLGYIDGRARANPGARATQGFAAVSKRWNLPAHFFVSLGVSANSKNNDVLSGHVQFLSSLGWRYDRYTLSLRHMSNGSIHGQNRGETFVQLSVGF